MDYEKKYKEAFAWAKSAIQAGAEGMLKEDLEKVFPELAESEGERIRKELINTINLAYDCGIAITKENRDKCLAWLAKQKEAQFGDEDRYMDGYMNGMNDALKGQNLAWSEEEFAHIVGHLVQDIVANEHVSEVEKLPTKFFVEKYYNKLRPQNRWKPSDEQIKVCKEVYADILSSKGFDIGTVNSELNKLEEKLKKLKG